MPVIPRREDTLARPRSRKGKDQIPVKKGTRRPLVTNVDPNEDWHPTARLIWDTALLSGQKDFYQDSDIAYLYHLCEELSEYKFSKRKSSQMLASLTQALSALLLTEGDRLRNRIELDFPQEQGPELTVVAMEQYRNLRQAT